MNRNRILCSLITAFLLGTSLEAATLLPDPAPAKDVFNVAGTLQGVQLRQVLSGLDNPVAVTHAGDSRLFITLRPGRIVILQGESLLPQPFLGIRDRVGSGGFEQGLLSTAFHPRYSENGFFFVNYTNLAGNTVIERYQVLAGNPNQADPASRRTLLTIEQPFSNHNGGQLQFGPDGYLYIGMGDGGGAFDSACRAQKTDTLLGKMLRIDVDQNVNSAPFYGIPADNPFRGAGNPPDEIWASGLRNPWRFTFDRETGDLWIGDVGQAQREEIDFQPAASAGGENYGWKVMEGTRCSRRDACPDSVPQCDSAAFTDPVLEYSHETGCSVTGGYVYRGASLPQLRGTYFFGDFCTGQIWGAARQGDGFVVRRLAETVGSFTSFGENQAGELFLVTLTGRLLRLEGQGGTAGEAERVGLFDPASSRFQLKAANTVGGRVQIVRFGPRRSSWTPLAGDWNGDGDTTIGFYDPQTATFRLKNALRGGGSDILLTVEPPSGNVIAVAGDWDGDGDDTVGLYDRTTGTFHLKNSLTGSGFDVTWSLQVAGVSNGSLLPLAGDWDGDGDDTVGVYNPGTSTFYLDNVRDDTLPNIEFQFGNRGSLPVAGDWDGDGRDGVGVYEPRSATFRLKNALSPGAADATFRFGPRRGGWLPIAGAW
jgi:glucose/arabinose dehydrogenase